MLLIWTVMLKSCPAGMLCPFWGKRMMLETILALAGSSPITAAHVSTGATTRGRRGSEGLLTDAVAGSFHDLQTVGQGLASTAVDEVVLGGQRRCLGIFSTDSLLSIEERARL